MAKKYSEMLGISSGDLAQAGAFDGIYGIDSKLHIDPSLLRRCSIPEFKNTNSRIDEYFTEIIRLIKQSKSKNDVLFRTAVKKLTFKEIKEVSLGFSNQGSSGNGIGPKLASRLAQTASEIIKAGIEDPVIFELVGLIEEDIGPDRISDMIAQIILPELLTYTERVAKDLKISTRIFKARGKEYQLPYFSGKNHTIILLPREVLRALPIANDWSDIDYVCAYNSQLRASLNKIIGRTWKKAIKTLKKEELRETLLHNPVAFQDLIDQYKKKKLSGYNFSSDPDGILIWFEEAINVTQNNPFKISLSDTPSSQEILKLVLSICNQFKKLIENNGLFRLLYINRTKCHNERYSQLLFFGIADKYCEVNNIDINREPNNGKGPVDFKYSKGYQAKVNVEIKLSSNRNLISGYEKQLDAYNTAEDTNHSVYLVIRVTQSEKNVQQLLERRQERIKLGKRVPEIIVVDGRWQSSASKIMYFFSINN